MIPRNTPFVIQLHAPILLSHPLPPPLLILRFIRVHILTNLSFLTTRRPSSTPQAPRAVPSTHPIRTAIRRCGAIGVVRPHTRPIHIRAQDPRRLVRAAVRGVRIPNTIGGIVAIFSNCRLPRLRPPAFHLRNANAAAAAAERRGCPVAVRNGLVKADAEVAGAAGVEYCGAGGGALC